MDHIVLPLDPDHTHALEELMEGATRAAGTARAPASSRPHITLLAHEGMAAAGVAAAITPVLAATPPFTVHAHGYGFFTGPEASDLSVHVPVVRGRQLDTLHRALCTALKQAGTEIAGWSESDRWSPHITLLDRELDPAALGRVAAWLAQRHHPSWHIPVDGVVLTGGWADRQRTDGHLPFGSRGGPCP